jgi:hypothetical protein
MGKIPREGKRYAMVAAGFSPTEAESRARPPIGLVNPLNDFLAALMLEIDINVGRLAALFTDKALKQ